VCIQLFTVESVIQLPDLFDCKPKLIKFFFHFMRLINAIKGGLHFIFLYLIEKCTSSSVFPWLRFVNKLSFHILFSSASRVYPSQEGLWRTEGSYSGVNIITRVAKNPKRVSARKYLRGLGNQCSRAAYNQGRLTLIH